MPLALISLIFCGTAFVFKNMVGSRYLLLSIVCTAITFSIMPDITEGIYWFTGAWYYIPGGVIFLAGMSIAFKNWGHHKTWHYFILLLFFIISSGFNEIIPLLGILAFSIWLLYDRKRIELALFLLLFIILFVYMFSAPGNVLRANHFSTNHQTLYSLFTSSAYTARFIGEWMVNPAILLWGLVLLQTSFNQISLERLSFLKNPFIAILILIAPTYICCFAPIWSTGILGQYRTANLSSYLFLPSFTLIVIANKDYLLLKLNLQRMKRYVFILLVIFLCVWKNQFVLIKEFATGEIAQFDREMNGRYELIKECKQPTCVIPEIENKSKTLFVYPLVKNPDHWMNSSYQMYFNSGKIILEEASASQD